MDAHSSVFPKHMLEKRNRQSCVFLNCPCFPPAQMQGITINVIIACIQQYLNIAVYWLVQYIAIICSQSMLVSGDSSEIYLLWCHIIYVSVWLHPPEIHHYSYWHGERHNYHNARMFLQSNVITQPCFRTDAVILGCLCAACVQFTDIATCNCLLEGVCTLIMIYACRCTCNMSTVSSIVHNSLGEEYIAQVVARSLLWQNYTLEYAWLYFKRLSVNCFQLHTMSYVARLPSMVRGFRL